MATGDPMCPECGQYTHGALHICPYQRWGQSWSQPLIPTGCMCPPTSEQTCRNPTCPRQGLRTSHETTAPAPPENPQ